MTEPQTSTSTVIDRRQDDRVDLGSAVQDLDGLMRLSKTLAVSGLLPDALRGKAADVLTMVLYGQDLGLSPMQSIMGIYVVKGKPQISGQLWIALARRAGHNPFVACKRCSLAPEQHTATDAKSHDYAPDHDPTRCKFTVVRGDAGARHTELFTIEDAKTARLLSNDNWAKYPKRMLLWRAATDAMRVICPEIALGFYAEGDDFTDDAEPLLVTAQRADEVLRDDIADGEIVDPEEAAAEVADLAAQFDFGISPQDPPTVPADLVCETCGLVGEHYEDECPKAVTPQ